MRCGFPESGRKIGLLWLAVALLAATPSPRTLSAGVVGNWDFANGWNPSTGLIPAASAAAAARS